MSQILTPEEMTALLEGLREDEDGSGSVYYHPPEEITTGDRDCLEPGRINRSHNLATLLMVLADLRWPHL
jgi:hypothetical protein